MAKSLRSKWKRKMKAEKRIKYGEREEKRLIKMLEAAKEEAVVDESRAKRLRISPLGFNNPLLNKLLKEMENKPKRSGDDVFDTFNGVRG